MSPERVPAWERRFRAPTVSLPTWSRLAPDRLVYATNEGGAWQVHTWDLASGTRRRITEDPVGVPDGTPTADGRGVVWLRDETGEEFGRHLVAPFEGGAGVPLFPGVPEGWPAGLALGRSVSAVGLALRDGSFAVWVVPAGGPPRELARHHELLEVGGAWRGGFALGGLSADERLLCVAHAEHGDSLHPALRVYDVATGEVVGELWDGPGLGLSAWAWSPVPGDARLAVVHEREDLERPAIWDLAAGERTDLELDLPGPVDRVLDWWPDGSALLLCHSHQGRDRLLRYGIASGRLEPVEHPEGTVADARVRPDGEVWFRMSSGGRAPRVMSSGGREVLAPGGERAPEGRPYRSWSFDGPGGRVHGFVVTPEGPGPFPLVLEIHGGPHWHWADAFSPLVQAWVDHGFAVALVNYRGSTGYGRAWRDAIVGNPGLTELDDLMAGVDDLVARGVADPERLVCSGESWGGYLTLLALSLHPERWACGVAGVPVGDYVAAYEDEAPALQAMDRGLFGGGPDELPEAYRERSPITYVDRVKAPVLVLAGENDSRCPIRQIDRYVEALRARGGEVEVYRYTTGHSSFLVDERVRQMRAKLEFVLRHVPAVGPAT
ncbi:MAG TPA: prolyl oligopeptidase family serine peptidase [Actinomycetota bacterium]|nr:prolyl oligopeptidase family serine peptidase [Actinomycetota bacterium]